MRARRARAWDHNTAYHRVVLNEARPGARRALDVGCGDGALARKLDAVVPVVVAIDADAPTVARARDGGASNTLEFRVADVLVSDVGDAFDLVCCVATLHHLPTLAGVRRLRTLVRPGGTLVIVGCARSRLPADLGWEVVAVVAHRVRSIWGSYRDHGAPTREPQETYGETRSVLRRELPGVRLRRRLFWRYTAVWRNELATSTSPTRA